jgi:hypothetical protein
MQAEDLLSRAPTGVIIPVICMPTDEELRAMARESAREKVGFYTHFAVYIVVNSFLIALWWFTGGPNVFPWFIFPLFGWGIGVAAHYVGSFHGKAYVENLAEREYQKLKGGRQ